MGFEHPLKMNVFGEKKKRRKKSFKYKAVVYQSDGMPLEIVGRKKSSVEKSIRSFRKLGALHVVRHY